MSNLYFSGFSLNSEKELFDQYRVENNFTVSGFSYGAQRALEYTLNSSSRVDLLQLFSPAYFIHKDKKYKRMQLMFFQKDPKKYCENFLKNCGFTQEQSNRYFKIGTYEQLDELLHYDWDQKKLQLLKEKNIRLEVYIGSEDKIVDSEISKEFFRQFGEVYFIKNKGHIL